MIHYLKIHVLYHIASAWRRVTRQLPQFLPFFFALLLIQSVFFSTLFVFQNNAKNEAAVIEQQYDYHVRIAGMSEMQKNRVMDSLIVSTTNSEVARCVRLIEHDLNESISGDKHYDGYFFLITGNKVRTLFDFRPDTLSSNYEAFLSNIAGIFKAENAPEITLSPLYRLEDRMLTRTLTGLFVIGVLAAVSVFILASLFSTRSNYHKFAYGMYAACGATSRKLEGIAFFELLVCTGLTLCPALGLSYFLCDGIYAARGIPFAFTWASALPELPLILIVVFSAVCPAMRLLAHKEPHSLLLAEDNANLLIPPRRSLWLPGKKFPQDYERITTLRLRKYHCKLAVVSALLCTVFVSGLYITNVYHTENQVQDKIAYDFTFTFDNETYIDDALCDTFRAQPYVGRIHKSYSAKSAFDLASHILIAEENVLAFSGLLDHPNRDDFRVTNDVQYMAAMDEDLIRMLRETYTITGDPLAVLTDSNAVIIANTYQNKHVLDYRPGDIVYVAIPVQEEPEEEYDWVTDENGNLYFGKVENDTETETEPPQTSYQDVVESMVSGDNLLLKQIEEMSFVRIPLTVAAVIENYPSAIDGIPLITGADTYQLITNESPKANTLYIYAEDEADGSDIDVLSGKIRHLSYLYHGASYIETGARLARQIREVSAYDQLLLLLSSFAVLFVPIAWFYSQILFYRKRENEFFVLQSIGADMKTIRGLHLQSVLLMIPVGIFSLLCATLTTALFYALSTFVFPVLFSSGSAVIGGFTLSPTAFIICFSLTLASCLASAYIPYLIYRAQHKPKSTFDSSDYAD